MPAISSHAKKKINGLISDVVEKYLRKAAKSPKADSGNPFVLALLRDFEPLIHRIHGLKTSIGNDMEKIAEIIATDAWGKANVQRKVRVNIQLPTNVFRVIDGIMSSLSNAAMHPNYANERKQIVTELKKPLKTFQSHTYELDLCLCDHATKQYYYLEMKGPDPNTSEVPAAKRRLLTALAYGLSTHSQYRIDAAIGIYYNNMHPNPFKNHKVLGYFDPAGDMYVHEKFWNFIGKSDTTYSELLKLFENYGKKNKKKIWDGFSKLIDVK